MPKKQKRQLFWFFAVIVIAFAVFIGTYFLMQSTNKFSYAGVRWEKIKYSNLDLYHANFPLFNNNFNFYLRNDPRTNNISVENVTFRIYPDVMVSIEPEASACYGAIIGQTQLGQFLGYANRKVISGISEESVAKEMGVPFANCSSAINRTVILTQMSDSPSIKQEGNCYTINVGNCENIATTERFLTAIIAQMNNATI